MLVYSPWQVNSEHPIAKAIVEEARRVLGVFQASASSRGELERESLEDPLVTILPPAAGFETIPGQGVKCQVSYHSFLIGNEKLLAENGVSVPLEAREFLHEAQDLARTGSTPLSSLVMCCCCLCKVDG